MNELSESQHQIDLNSDEYFMNEAIKEAKRPSETMKFLSALSSFIMEL